MIQETNANFADGQQKLKNRRKFWNRDGRSKNQIKKYFLESKTKNKKIVNFSDYLKINLTIDYETVIVIFKIKS